MRRLVISLAALAVLAAPAAAVSTTPKISGLELKPSSFQVLHSTMISLRLNRAARITFHVRSVATGKRLPGRFFRNGKAGANTFTWRGTLAGSQVPPGRYTLEARPWNGSRPGNLETVSFRIKPIRVCSALPPPC